MLKFELDSRKKLLRNTLSVLIPISVLTGCVSLPQKQTENGECYNEARADKYKCSENIVSPQSNMHTAGSNKEWMASKLSSVHSWLKPDKQANITAEGTSTNVIEAKTVAVPNYISTVSIVTPTPQHRSPELTKILSLSQQGEHQEALNRLDVIIKDNPNMASAKLAKGIILSNKGDRTAAKKSFKQLMKAYPGRPEAFNNLAVIYAEEGNFLEAINTLQQAFQTHPSYAQVHTNLKEIYATLASQAYNKALDLSSESSGPELAMINLVPRDLTNSTSEHLVLIATKKEPKQPTQGATAAPPEPVKPEVKIEKPTTKTVEVSSLVNEPVAVTTAVAKEQVQTNQNKVTKPIKAEETSKPVNPKPAVENTVEQQITNNLLRWANAWSNKDYKGYIATYTDVYRPNAKLTHKQWVKQREHRITKPKFIKVSISNIEVKLLQDNLAEALFEQRYQSDTYKDAVKKRVMLVNSNGQWKISLEKSLGHIRK
jgi:Flp pilus assembly protein TadD